MKKILFILISALCVISCKNKDLYYGDNIPANRQPVDVLIHWNEGDVKPAQGMRVNLFSLNDMSGYGVDDLAHDGGTLHLRHGSCHMTLCYNYHGNNIYFRNEGDPDLIEAYCNSMVRATYSKTFPDESTVAEPDAQFYVGKHESFDVYPSADRLLLELYPENVMRVYTFEVRGVTGAQFISATRGAISGMSNSFFLNSGALSTTYSTILFSATTDVAGGKITGSFRTFGRIDDSINNFTIEVLYPSSNGGILQKTWDVTSQIDNGTNYHILIEDSGIVVPDEGGSTGGGGGFEADVEEWENEVIELK